MLQYRFFTGPDDAAFCQRVTDALNEGWRLYGSPSLTWDGGKVIAGQAVVREVEDTDAAVTGVSCKIV